MLNRSAQMAAKQTAGQVQASHNVSRNQSERIKTINEKAEEWVDKDSKSGMLVFAWTGRCPVGDALVRFYGTPFASLSPIITSKLSDLIRSLADSSHPRFEDAIKLLEMGINNDSVQLEEDSVHGFIKHLVKKQTLLPLQAPLVTEAWAEYQSEIQPTDLKHERKKKLKATTRKLPGKEEVAMTNQAEAAALPDAPKGGLRGGIRGRGLDF